MSARPQIFIKIPETSLNRDMNSRGLVETDTRKIKEYREKTLMANKAKLAQDEISNIKKRLDEMDVIKNDIVEIKALLQGLVR